MVVDIHTNVIEQGKQLEKVEVNIEKTKENVQKAEKEIIIARFSVLFFLNEILIKIKKIKKIFLKKPNSKFF